MSTKRVKKNVQIKCTDNAKIEIGKNSLIQDNSFILLTKPEPELNIGNNVKIGGGSGVIEDIKDNSVVMGYPAESFKTFIKRWKKND